MSNEGKGTKLCKHCKTEIPKDAKVCPNCRKKQGSKLVPIIVVIAVIIFIMFACSGGGEDKETKIEKGTAGETAEETKEDSDKEESLSELVVGDSVEKSGLKVTINELSSDFQDYNNEYGINTPEEGEKYVMASFTFENTGDTDKYVDIYEFDCYADNATCNQVYSLDDSDFINTNLSAGRNVSFKTYYAVPVDAQSIELEYKPGFWNDEKVIIRIQ